MLFFNFNIKEHPPPLQTCFKSTNYYKQKVIGKGGEPPFLPEAIVLFNHNSS